MFKKLLAGLTALVLSLGLVSLTATSASAHAGNITASAVCNPQTGKYDVTYTLSWSNVPHGVTAPISTRTGGYDFQGWDYGSWNDWTSRGTTSGSSGSIQWTESIPGTDRNGPWVYAYTPWSNGHSGERKHDTRVERLAGDCGVVKVTPDAPSFEDATCAAPGVAGTTARFHIPATNSGTVTYLVAITNSDTTPSAGAYAAAVPGWNDVPVGKWVHVKAEAISPAQFKHGVTTSWRDRAGARSANDCIVDVTPTKPTVTHPVCTADGQAGQGSYTIPAITGIQYKASSSQYGTYTDIAAGTHPAAPGATVYIRAYALSGYELTDTSRWESYKQYELDIDGINASKCVVPVAPTPNYQVCTTPGNSSQATYVIPSDKGVTYQRWNGTQWKDVSNGTVNVNSFPTTVQLRAVPSNSSYTFVPGSTTTWTFSFTSAGDCLRDVTPATPTFTNAQCEPTTTGVTQGGYFIATTPHVSYTVSLNGGAAVPATTGSFVNTNPGDSVVITATAASGYVLKGYSGPWDHTFANPGDCLDDATPVEPTQAQSECTVPGDSSPASFTVIAATGVSYEASTDGGQSWAPVASGSHPATPGTTVLVRAVADPGYKLAAGYDGPWTLAFADPGDCVEKVTPATPGFASAICATDGSGSYGTASYTIPETAGVTYQVRFGVVGPWADKAAGTYSVDADQYLQVRAVAQSGYQLEGTTKWVQKFTIPDCLTDVTSTKPTQTQAVCTGEEKVGPASFAIPEITGVKYQELVDWTWVDRAPGSHPAVDGSLVTLRAVPLAGYELTDHDWLSANKTYLLWFDNLNAAKDCIVPDEPTFDPQVCTTPGDPSQATYTVPSDTGVRYQVWNGATWENIAAGTYDVDSFPTTVQLRAVPKSGHHFLSGATTEWSFDFAAAGDCIEDATAAPATDVDQLCTVGEDGQGVYTSGYLVIPNSPNVDYFVDGDPIAAGEHDRVPGTYVVSAVAHDGYQLVGYSGPWELEIEAAEACGELPDHPVVDPIVTFQQTTCTVAGSYTLAVDPAEESAGVIWTVSGGLPNTVGKHSVFTAGTVTITATPAPGYGFTGLPVPPREYSFDFANLPDDCLPTLALTGVAGGAVAGGLGVAAALTLGGVLLLAARRRDRMTAEQ